MNNKTLQTWLDEMDKLDREATKGPWLRNENEGWENEVFVVTGKDEDGDDITERIVVTDSGFYPPEDNDSIFISRSRTELPRAVKVINYYRGLVREFKTTFEGMAELNEDLINSEIEKILNEG